MRGLFAGAVLIAVGWPTIGTGVAHGDEVEVEASYSTLTACQVDGPHVEIDATTPYTHWAGREAGDGLYHLYLSH